MAYTNEVKWLHCALIGRSNGGGLESKPIQWDGATPGPQETLGLEENSHVSG